MNKILHLLALLLNLCLLSWLHCSTPEKLTGGSSSETVIGLVVNIDGSPACSSVVMLYPADFNPFSPDNLSVLIPADTTDSDGNYRISVSDSTTNYSIVATDPHSGKRALLTGITTNEPTTSVPNAVLSNPGSISIAIPESSVSGYAYIPGTDIAAHANSSGMIFLDQVPAGTIPLINFVSGSTSRTLASDVKVVSNSATIIPYPQWKYSAQVYLNTTVSGADVAGDVTDFPLLVRLTDSTFDFTQTQINGEDLRFSGVDGTRLEHEIELWDALNGIAAIWVRVPVVLGNNDSQFIVMHWGSSDAQSTSDGAAVFDTLAGFQAVWHLSGTGNAISTDATANGYHGTEYNMVLSEVIDGMIGHSKIFNGTTSYITIPNSASGKLDLPQQSEYSISLWAYADSIDTLWHVIAGKGHEQYYLKLKCFSHSKASLEFVEFQDQKGWEFTEDSITPRIGAKEWVYLTGVRSGVKQYLYINGVLVDEPTRLMSGTYPRVTSDNFTIGKYARRVTIPYDEGWCYFRGRIDEIRVRNRASSPDWVRLCYMNQKTGSMLVEFR